MVYSTVSLNAYIAAEANCMTENKLRGEENLKICAEFYKMICQLYFEKTIGETKIYAILGKLSMHK